MLKMPQIQELVKEPRSNCGLDLTFELILVVSLGPLNQLARFLAATRTVYPGSTEG
jgi:hypothetical protein